MHRTPTISQEALAKASQGDANIAFQLLIRANIAPKDAMDLLEAYACASREDLAAAREAIAQQLAKQSTPESLLKLNLFPHAPAVRPYATIQSDAKQLEMSRAHSFDHVHISPDMWGSLSCKEPSLRNNSQLKAEGAGILPCSLVAEHLLQYCVLLLGCVSLPWP
jgi:hypothetical protein